MRRNYLKRLVGRRVVLHTTDDQSVRGVLAVAGADCLVLEAPEYLGKAADPDTLEGRVGVLRANLSFWQEL